MPFISSIRKNHKTPNTGEASIANQYDIQGGDLVYDAGGYRIHCFLETGTQPFTMTPKSTYNKDAMTLSTVDLEYLVIAGGGGGGGGGGDTGSAGGGGAGGYRVGTLAGTGAGDYTITTGANGAQGYSQPSNGSRGGARPL